MTKQEQIEEMAVIGCVRNPQAHTAEECAKCDFKQGQCNAYRHAEALYDAGYRKVPDGAVVLTPEERDDEMKATNEILAERDDLIAKVGVLGRENYDLKAENEQLKAKLEKNPLAIKQKIMEEDDYELTEREQEIERLKAEFKQLQTNSEILARGVRDLNHENYELTEKIKQAKIDVLNKLKEKFKGYEAWYYDGIEESYHDLEEEIDEFIKELINNAKDKS